MKRILFIFVFLAGSNFLFGADDDVDLTAQRGAQYNDNGLIPPSQNPSLAQNQRNAPQNQAPNPNAQNQLPNPNLNSFDGLSPFNQNRQDNPNQNDELRPHEYPMSDRLNSPDVASAQLKNAIDYAQKGDLKNAFDLFKKSCENGNAAGCFGLGTMYASGTGVQININRAKHYYEMGCASGDVASCTNLAMIYSEQNPTKENQEMAAQFYMTACQGGDAIACNNLGFMYANGEGVRKEFFTAIKYYKLACDGGSNLGCYNLGLMTNTQNLLKNNKANLSKADLNYAACNAGDMKGCANLGFLYANGSGGAPLSYAYAAKYFKKACEAYDIGSCNNLGVLYQKGLGVTQNTNYALDLYSYACNSGFQKACDNYRILKQDLQINPKPKYNLKPQTFKKSPKYAR